MAASNMMIMRPRVTSLEWVVMLVVSAFFVGLTLFQVWSLTMTEVLGFVTGGVCVWLVVREDMINWPIGLANNAVFFVLFLSARLYADMALQIVYFGLGVYGWVHWVRGGVNQKELVISRTKRWEWLVLAGAIPLLSWGMVDLLVAVGDAAPLWDGLTTVLSLAAQFLLCRKRLENWFFWIAADLIYVPLYLSRNLPLTAILYGVFLVMCLIGFAEWRNKWRRLGGYDV